MEKSISYLIRICLIFLLLYASFVPIEAATLQVCSITPQGTISSYISHLLNKNADNSNVENTKFVQKKVFLTFDDGPSITNTSKIIEILKKNNIKATFFVVGTKIERYPDIVKEMSDNKMSICVHTYSHDYDKIYKSVDSFLEDIDQCNLAIKKITGKKVTPYIRLPGGSDNLVSGAGKMKKIRAALKVKNIRYVDWNVSSGDALSHLVPTYKLEKNVISQCKNKTTAVVLMHDAYYKTTTVEALPAIISSLKQQGFVFETFDNITSKEEASLIKIRVINRGAKN